MSPYKWFREGAVDPQTGLAWPAPPDGGWVRMRGWRGFHSHAVTSAGLPYEIADELWEVELDEIQGTEPFPEQRQHVRRLELLRDGEQRIRATRGRLVRRIEAWGADPQAAFADECAARARGRVLQALRDAATVLDAASSPAGQDSDDQVPMPVPLDHEATVLLHAERMITGWRSALPRPHVDVSLRPVDAGRAAAITREVAALTYATEGAGAPSDRATAASAAYLASRRWQSTWLAERLGLPAPLEDVDEAATEGDRDDRSIGSDTPAMDILHDLSQLRPEARKQILATLHDAHEQIERAKAASEELRQELEQRPRRRLPMLMRRWSPPV